MQEEKQELVTEQQDDDGPPPGFQCIITAPPPPAGKPDGGGAEEEESPPPGFGSIVPKSLQSIPSSDMATSSKEEKIHDDDDDRDDDDGPPPGWEFTTLVNALPKPPSITTDNTDVKIESNDELDEGPPPGWEMVLPHKMLPPCTPPLQPSSTATSNTEMGSKQIITRNDDELPPSVPQCTALARSSSPATPPASSELSSDTKKKEENKKTGGKKPTSGHQHESPLQKLPSTPSPLTPAQSSSGKAQLVCGTCRKLCVYPRGAKWVRCPGCQEANFVLEAHEIGQVKCGGCSVLLMYQHGSPAVQCSSCRFVTEIGAHNRRPPLSIQHAQRLRRSNRVR